MYAELYTRFIDGLCPSQYCRLRQWHRRGQRNVRWIDSAHRRGLRSPRLFEAIVQKLQAHRRWRLPKNIEQRHLWQWNRRRRRTMRWRRHPSRRSRLPRKHDHVAQSPISMLVDVPNRRRLEGMHIRFARRVRQRKTRRRRSLRRRIIRRRSR